MLEKQSTLLPEKSGSKVPKIFLVGLLSADKTISELAASDDDSGLEELKRLSHTLGYDVGGEVKVKLRAIHSSTYIGSGKLDEISQLEDFQHSDCVLIDVELSPSQMRNVEKKLAKPVFDRPSIIIEIFSAHAKTREAKTQVELARNRYLYPRLSHYWSHFERQRGGAAGNRGMGEKQIEVDRRLVKKRIASLEKNLKEIQAERAQRRRSRETVSTVALVGYTNAGKSTLLNQLTHSQVRAEDKLFATLDSSVKALNPHTHPPIVMIDTVGFISRLPPFLVASFRSTLEELQYADLLLHIVDASSPQAVEQINVTKKVLDDLGLSEKPQWLILNKMDLINAKGAVNWTKTIAPGARRISATRDEDIRQLRTAIIGFFWQGYDTFEVLIPYEESKIHSQLHARGHVESQKEMPKGIFYRLKMEPLWIGKLGLRKFLL